MNGDSAHALLLSLHATPVQREPSLDSFWRAHRARTADVALPFDRAVLGGGAASSVGQAFVAGYRSALQRMFPVIDRDAASFCVTEERGGHPRAIGSTLLNGELNGHKRWVSVGDQVAHWFVVARESLQSDGRPLLRVAHLAADTAGVTVTPMPPTPFVPDVAHAELVFDRVAVAPTRVLEGDGYQRFVKPFRSIEDVHVFGALLGYLAVTARASSWPAHTIAPLYASIVTLRSLALSDTSDPMVHLALSGVIEHAQHAIAALDAHWPSAIDDRREGWERDRALLLVANRARVERTHTAATMLGLHP